jgi:3'(2'), 5'-bisphosphate nucleotidase
MTGIRDLMEIASRSALEAGKLIFGLYNANEFPEVIKAGEFPSVRADKMAHSTIIQYLAKTNLPVLSEEGRIISFSERQGWEYFWLVDPLDGTKEFIHKNGEFTVNIALIHKNDPVGGVIYAPCTDSMYIGSTETGVYKTEKGTTIQFSPLDKKKHFSDLLRKDQVAVIVSRSHLTNATKDFISQFKQAELKQLGSSLKFMCLLENGADIYPRFGSTMEWDTAAAHAILNASNRGVYHIDLKSELAYNKKDLMNPFFIAF